MATAKKTAVPKKYRNVPAGDFALGKGKYPVNTPKRARSALSRIAQNGTPAQQKTVQAAVRKKYPSIAVNGRKGKSR